MQGRDIADLFLPVVAKSIFKVKAYPPMYYVSIAWHFADHKLLIELEWILDMDTIYQPIHTSDHTIEIGQHFLQS